MKTLLIFLFPIFLFSQTYVELKGGYANGGMLIGAGLEQNINRIVLDLQYREYNIVGEDPREILTAIGYELLETKFNIKPTAGVVYRWTTGEFIWESGVQFNYMVDTNKKLFVEVRHLNSGSILLGAQVRFTPSRNKKHRFF